MLTRDELDRQYEAIEKLWDSVNRLHGELATQALHIAVLKSEFAQQKSGNASMVAFVTSIISSVAIAAILSYLKLKS